MTTLRARSILLAPALGLALALSACAAGPGDGSTLTPVDDMPVLDAVDVAGEGTVIQIGDARPQFCLGPIAESYPPQCSGPELVGWDWDTVDGEESSGDVTWGTYAVTGKWDGTSLLVGSAIMLALYDPLPVPDPALDADNAGTTSEERLLEIQSGIADDAPVEVLSTWVENGYLFVRVLFDDGALQDWADDAYGPDVVQIRPALRVLE
ncbi:hypothetical protein [Antiquaquibacter soli]|uniref:Uncharacterized protein n=1 Tax=Antiquaquibacter soli TaxID=3064523 RepID=A0ABT9BMC4_9MICO|nr:hypothetical protein [Protaetiibacter sp. WY-16]MDO7882182.1 hypothetical protein [Protaetiibacter sp. WY-16]